MSSRPFSPIENPSILISREVGREVRTPVTVRCRLSSPGCSVILSAAMLASAALRFALLCTPEKGGGGQKQIWDRGAKS